MLGERHTLIVLATTVLWATALWYLTTRWKSPLMLPLALLAAIIGTHAVLALLPLPDDLVATWGLMFSVPSGGRPIFPLVTGDYADVDWTALAPIAGDMVAVAVLAILSDSDQFDDH